MSSLPSSVDVAIIGAGAAGLGAANALKAGYGRKGAKIGSRDGDADLFKADMLAFWRRTLG